MSSLEYLQAISVSLPDLLQSSIYKNAHVSGGGSGRLIILLFTVEIEKAHFGQIAVTLRYNTEKKDVTISINKDKYIYK